jgi:hypothetical protein
METRPEFSQLAIPHWIASLPESGGVLEAVVFLANPEDCTLRVRIPHQLTATDESAQHGRGVSAAADLYKLKILVPRDCKRTSKT